MPDNVPEDYMQRLVSLLDEAGEAFEPFDYRVFLEDAKLKINLLHSAAVEQEAIELERRA